MLKRDKYKRKYQNKVRNSLPRVLHFCESQNIEQKLLIIVKLQIVQPMVKWFVKRYGLILNDAF